MEIRTQPGLKIHFALSRPVERAGRQAASETAIFEQVALLLGALEAAENYDGRHPAVACRRNPQISGDGEAFEREVEPLRRHGKGRRGLLVQLDLAPLSGLALLRLVKPQKLRIVIGQARLPEQLCGTLPAPLLHRLMRQRFIAVAGAGPERIPIVPMRELRPCRGHVPGGHAITYQADAAGAPDVLENRVAHEAARTCTVAGCQQARISSAGTTWPKN